MSAAQSRASRWDLSQECRPKGTGQKDIIPAGFEIREPTSPTQALALMGDKHCRARGASAGGRKHSA
eukprot:8918555-Pyramimonas_sp.AAC.1